MTFVRSREADFHREHAKVIKRMITTALCREGPIEYSKKKIMQEFKRYGLYTDRIHRKLFKLWRRFAKEYNKTLKINKTICDEFIWRVTPPFMRGEKP